VIIDPWASTAKKIACKNVRDYAELSKRYEKDSLRVLRVVKNKWATYSHLLWREQGEKQYDNMVAMAKKDPADFYLYLVLEHLQKPWQNRRPGHEASSLSAWRKLSEDNKYLWEMKQLAYISGR